ncbi:hypothetical protein BDZ91DRAFT_740357, partial [Kalaharituber pfeilii]
MQTPPISSQRSHQMNPTMFTPISSPLSPPRNPTMFTPISPPLSPPRNPTKNPTMFTPISPPLSPPTNESQVVNKDGLPSGYLAPTLQLPAAHKTIIPASKIIERHFEAAEALSAEEADWPCRGMGFKFLLRALTQLVGVSAQLTDDYAAWIRADISWFIQHGFDFGMAYACTRKGWRPLLLPDDVVDLAAYRNEIWDEYNKAMEWRKNILVLDEETGYEVIEDPYEVKPNRIWDLKSNRVVDYTMLCANLTAYAKVAGEDELDPEELHYDSDDITHSWTKDSDKVVYNTSVNGYQWPVRFPARVTIEQVRRELLSFDSNYNDYVWLDVMCLRQDAGARFAMIKDKEWKIDVPTIGNIYQLATCVVRYLNGLGRVLSNRGWDDERHWLQRAWTLQEIREPEVTHNGGVPAEIMHPMNIMGEVNGRQISLRKALAPLADYGCCELYDLTREMGRRKATNEADKVAGLFYLLHTTRLPAYSAAVPASEVWVRCFHELPFLPRLEILFDFPYRGDSGTWFPSWSQLMNWPDRKPELTYEPPQWDDPFPFYVPPSENADMSHLYITNVRLVPNVWLEP